MCLVHEAKKKHVFKERAWISGRINEQHLEYLDQLLQLVLHQLPKISTLTWFFCRVATISSCIVRTVEGKQLSFCWGLLHWTCSRYTSKKTQWPFGKHPVPTTLWKYYKWAEVTVSSTFSQQFNLENAKTFSCCSK